jgi:NDP-hexose-3-ketoreductase
MSSLIRVGALGNARILKRFTSESDINSLIEVQLIATLSANAAEKARHNYPNKIITDRYEDAVASKDLDAIYICLPSGLHCTWAEKALAAGKHVLIEKPAVLTEQDAQGLASLARSQRLFVMEAWWYRFHPLIETVRAFIATQALGKIRLITSNFSYVNTDLTDTRWKADLGGGALNDMFCYHIDFLSHVMGINNDQVELVQAFSQMRQGVDASISAELVTSSGTVCQFMSGINRHSMCKTFILGERGSLEIPHARILPEMGASTFMFHSSSGTHTHTFEATDAYLLMFKAFADAINHQQSSQLGLDELVQNTKLMTRIRLASQEP